MTILSKLSLNAKTGILVAITALVVAYVRTFFQYPESVTALNAIAPQPAIAILK